MGSESIYEMHDKVKDILRFLTSSSIRTNIMLILNESPKNLGDLKQELDLGSSTLIHSLNELEKRNFIIRESTDYTLSQTGKAVTLELIKLIKTTCVVNEYKKLWLNHEIGGIPEDLIGKIGDLNNSTLIEADSTHLTKVLDYFVQLLMKSKMMKGVSPIYHPYLPKAMKSAISEGANVQLIVTNKVLEVLNKSHPEILTKLSENYRLYVIDEDVKEAFTVTDTCISFGLFTEGGEYDFNKDLYSESKEAIRWCEKLFEYYLKRSKRLV